MVDRRIADGTMKNRDVLKGFIVAIVVAGVVFLAIIGSLTLANTNTAVNDLKHTSVQHGETLTHIDHVAKVDMAELEQLKTATITVDKILSEAGAISTQLLQGQQALCAAIPGCHL